MAAKVPNMKLGIRGATNHGGAVTPGEFGAFLTQIEKCLKLIKPIVGAGRVVHVLTGLKIGSATGVISPLGSKKAMASAALEYEFMQSAAEQIQSGKLIDPRIGYAELMEFKKLGRPIQNGAQSVTIGNVRITEKYLSNIEIFVGSPSVSVGTVKGKLEKIDLHNKNEFIIFPPLPGYSITCIFPEDMYTRAHEALRKNVNITGIMLYQCDAPYPQKVNVTDIDILPGDAELPTIFDLQNSIPDITNGLAIGHYLEKIRD